jgi:hypothetical protein
MAKADDTQTLDEIDVNEPDGIKNLRSFAERKAREADEAKQLRRELSMVKAGIDLDSRKGQAWAAQFPGDTNDVAAMLADARDFDPSIVKAAAPPAEAGTTTPPGETTTAPAGATGATTTAPADTGSAARTALADGALPSEAAAQDPVEASVDAARAAIAQGATNAEAVGGMIAMRARAAADGKISVLDAAGRRVTLGQ